MGRVTEFLETHQSPTPSHWRKDAQWRRDNEHWLKYSRCITIQVLKAMEVQSVTQVELARRMGCSQQYVSNLLKGSSNMTLETIARLEDALSIDLIRTALTYVSGFNPISTSKQHYLNDSPGEEADPDLKTSNLVDGNKPRKK